MSKQQNQKPQRKNNKKEISVITGKQRRENSKNNNKRSPGTSNQKFNKTPNPSGHFSGNKLMVRKKEYIMDVIPASSFSPVKIEINPALPESFPWLSGIAPSFQKYKIIRFRVEFRTTRSTFTPGIIGIAPEYNVSEPLPDTKIELYQYQGFKNSAVWQNFSVEIPRNDIMNYKDYYIRNNTAKDYLLYDPFYLIITNSGTELETSLGEIWFDYDIELSVPQSPIQRQIEVLHYKFFTLSGNFDGKHLGETQVSKGEFPIVVNQGTDQTIQFNKDFTGQMQITTRDDIGTADDMSVNPGVLIGGSSEFPPLLTAACGGSGYGQTDSNVWRTYSYDVIASKGDLLVLSDTFAYLYPNVMYLEFYQTGIYESIV